MSDTVTILGIAFALAMDAFAVSIGVSAVLKRATGRHYFRLAWHFGLFQFLMPVAGWLLGTWVTSAVEAAAHWIAGAILLVLGGRMIRESRTAAATPTRPGDPTRGWSLVLLSVATSVDAFAAGLGLALLGARVVSASVTIGLVAGGMTLLGMRFGAALGRRAGHRAEFCGGVLLVLLALRVTGEAILG